MPTELKEVEIQTPGLLFYFDGIHPKGMLMLRDKNGAWYEPRRVRKMVVEYDMDKPFPEATIIQVQTAFASDTVDLNERC